MKIALCAIMMTSLLCLSCQDQPAEKKAETIQKEAAGMALTITSPAFAESAMIPGKYTCDGEDISPPLTIAGTPENTGSLALIADDPDAPRGTWVHWVLFNLPPETTELVENVPPDEQLENGALHGVTDFGRFGYGGPCPPGGTHRYFFKVYALDSMLDISGQVTKAELESALEGHVLAEGQLMGRYKRQ